MADHWKKMLDRFDEIVGDIPEIERKGKSVPYTSANGHMYSLLNKEGELGIRLGTKEAISAFAEQYGEEYGFLKSHGAFMRGYVRIPDHVLKDTALMTSLLREGLAYVNTLPPK
ncbi:MAG: hypothetical protein KTR24_14680 [Saprospiraceae bacterium]|nr:hypothetical protein [Saprospiraceae bacterium]